MEEALSTEQPGAQTTSPMADRGDGGASTIGDSDSIGGEHPLQDPLEDVSVMEVLAGAGGGKRTQFTAQPWMMPAPPPPRRPPRRPPCCPWTRAFSNPPQLLSNPVEPGDHCFLAQAPQGG